MSKKLYRSKSNKMLAGVCGGNADYFSIDPTIIRLIFAALVLFTGAGILAYIVAAFIIPEEPDEYTDVDASKYE